MRQKPQHLLIWVILIYVNVPGIAQIDPIKTAKDLGKSIPGKKDQSTSNTGTANGRPTPAPSTTSSRPTSTPSNTNTATPLDASAESSPAKSFIALIKDWESYANQDATPIPGKVAELEKSINENTAKWGLTTHRELVGMEVFWSAVVKIFPNLPLPSTALQSVKAALGRLGTEAQMLAKFNKNEVEKMKNTKMPTAVTVNPALEAEFKKAFVETGWGESIVKINLLTRDWTTLYHNITGNIIGRAQEAAIAAKQKDGNCILYSFSIVQEYTGAGKYGASKRYSHGVIADKFLCENAK